MEGEVSWAVEIVEESHGGEVICCIVVRSEVRVCNKAKGVDYALVDRLGGGFFFFLEPGFFPEDGGLDLLPLVPVEAALMSLSAAAAFRALGFEFFLLEALGEEPLRTFFGGVEGLDLVLVSSSRTSERRISQVTIN